MFLYVQHLLNNIPQMYSASVIWLALYSVTKLQTIYYTKSLGMYISSYWKNNRRLEVSIREQ